MTEDQRVTDYIIRSADFARPILVHLRALVAATVPDAAETIKWGMPFFEVYGRPLAMIAAFKAHAGFGIFDGAPMPKDGNGMGQFGKLTAIADLPDTAELARRLVAATGLIVAGPSGTRPRAAPKPPLAMPDDLVAALAADVVAETQFNAFPPGARRDYIEWIMDARLAATRTRRIAATVEWRACGKRRNWKHEAG